jgi:L-lactate dehydrogenase (cytochrome)
VPLEAILEEAPRSWYQGYIPGDEEMIKDLVARLLRASVPVLVVTVDVPVASNRDLEKRLGFSVPLRPQWSLAIDGLRHPRWTMETLFRTLLRDGTPTLPNFTGQQTGRKIIAMPTASARVGRDRFTWKHVAFIRRLWPHALVVKGILSPEDARLAVQHGVDGMIVSNHGGRQLDGAISAMDVLPHILDSAGDLPICVDGGIRRGTDALKALALGAQMVFVGRPMLYAVTSGGQGHVELAIRILSDEIQCDLALLGCRSVQDLNVNHVMRA